MDTATITAELEAERDRLDSAIAALRGNPITFRKSSGKPDGRKRPFPQQPVGRSALTTKKRRAEGRKKKKAA